MFAKVCYCCHNSKIKETACCNAWTSLSLFFQDFYPSLLVSCDLWLTWKEKKYHTFENLILTDKLLAIIVSKGMWKMDYHEQLQILYYISYRYAMTRKNIVCMTPQSFPIRTNMLISWHFLIFRLKFFSQGVIWWVWSFWTSFAQKILNLFPSWKCFHVGASYVMMICINTYIE